MKLASQEGLLPGKSLAEKVKIAEQLGLEGIELGGRSIEERYNEIVEAFSTSKIKVSTICSGYPGDLLSADRREREKAIEGILKRLEIAHNLGAVGLIVVPTFGGPKLPDLYPLFPTVWELEKKLLIEELRIIDRKARTYNSFVLLEPLNRYETHFLNRLEDTVSIIEEVNGERIMLMADFFHMNIEEADIASSLKKVSKYLKHIHLADSNRVLPGFGHTDFSKPFKVLKDIGYKYYMAFECRVPEPRIESLKKSIEFLRKLIR